MYEDLYEKIKDEEDKLNTFLRIINFENKVAYEYFNLAKQNRDAQKDLVDELLVKKNKMLSKHNLIVNVIKIITVLGLSVCAFIGWLLMIHLLLINNIAPNLAGAILAVGLFGGCVLASSISILLDFKIKKKFLKKIENSSEYKELLGKINKAEIQLALANKRVKRKEKIYKWQKGMYNQVVLMRDKKRALLNYIDNEMNSKETAVHKSRVFKKVNKTTTNN